MRRTERVRRTEEVLTGIIVAVEIKVEITPVIAIIIALATTPLIAVIIVTMNVLRLAGGKNILKQRIDPRCSILFYEITTQLQQTIPIMLSVPKCKSFLYSLGQVNDTKIIACRPFSM